MVLGKYLANEASCNNFFGKFSNVEFPESSAENLHFVFDIGDQPTVVSSESPVQSFKWTGEKPSSVNSNIVGIVLWRSLTRSHLGSTRKALPKKNHVL